MSQVLLQSEFYFFYIKSIFKTNYQIKDKNLEAFKANSQVGLVVAVLLFIEKQSEFFS
jgi:hypothetical protein